MTKSNQQSMFYFNKEYKKIIQAIELQNEEKYDQAILASSFVVETQQENAVAYFCRGKIYSEIQEYKEAIKDYSSAISIDPNYADAYNNRGNLYQILYNYKEAIKDYSSAISIDPNYADAYNNRGNLYQILYNYKEAIIDYSSAISIDSKFFNAYIKRGKIYYILQRNEDAIKDYTSAISIDPNYVDAYNKRGDIYYKSKRYEDAIKDYTRAISIDPNNFYAYNNRGMIYDDLQRYLIAMDDYTSAIYINPNYACAYVNRGKSQLKLIEDSIYIWYWKYEGVIEDYTSAISIDPNYVDAYNKRGNIYYILQRYEDAIKDYTSAISIDPNNFYAYNNRGNSYYHLQLYEKAINDYISGQFIFPNNLTSLTALGVIYCIRKELPLSREYLYRAKELLQNISAMDLQRLDLNEENFHFIKQLLNLLTEIDTEISKIKEELTVLYRRNQITSEEEQDYYSKIDWVELDIQNDLRSYYFNPLERKCLMNNLNQRIQEVNRIKSNYQKLEVVKIQEQNQFIQMKNDMHLIQQQEQFVIQQELYNLQLSDNINQYLYYKSLFWRLYNYLHAMSLISSELFLINKNANIQSHSEMVLNIVQKAVKEETGIKLLVPVVGQTFAIINKALDSLVENNSEQKFKQRMIKLTNILQQLVVTPSQLEQEIQFGVLNLIKNQNFIMQEEQEGKFEQYINEVSILENNFEKNSKNPIWKLGIKHSIVILNYLETYYEEIFNKTYITKLRDLIFNSVNFKQQYTLNIIEKKVKIVEATNESCSCQMI